MKIKEYLLVCLTEECAELIQSADKCLRFGMYNSAPRGGPTNELDMLLELNHVFAVAEMIWGDGSLRYPIIDREQIEDKKKKVQEYMDLSRERGLLNTR